MSRIILGLAFTVVLLVACETKSEQSQVTQATPVQVIEKVGPDAFKNAISADESEYIILDVRTPAEFNSGTVPDAINIDFKDAGFESEVNTLDKNKTVYMFCQGGVRSSKAAAKMEMLGFTKIVELERGFSTY